MSGGWDVGELREAVKKSSSIKGSLLIMGKHPGGWNYEKFHQLVSSHSIDISHFETIIKSPTQEEPHPKLVPLLEKYDLPWEIFNKKGRPPKGVSEKRYAIVTELHATGMKWERMVEITGKSIMFIKRNTKAIGNANSRQNVVEAARRTGKAGAGRQKAWLSEQMKKKWENGDFDFHVGRVRSEEECQALRDSFTPERRKQLSKRFKRLWKDPSYRKPLLRFHRSEKERQRRSEAQARRVQENPEKWGRGNGSYVSSPKCNEGEEFWVRSSYEAAAVLKLTEDDDVTGFEYEPERFEIEGRVILPDFLVQYTDGMLLIEVKASWTLEYEEHQNRIALSEKLAAQKGWRFELWTEKNRLTNVI